MDLPFTAEQFFNVFRMYNEDIWPVQIIAYLLGIVVIGILLKRPRYAGSICAAILALFWGWTGVFYHIFHFSSINPAARIFGFLFLIQAGILLIFGVILNRLKLNDPNKSKTFIGWVLILFSMFIYPGLGYMLGHDFDAQPMFGVTPCPSVIFTFGVLLFTDSRVPWYVFLIPLLWSLAGASAAINLEVPQDYGLVVAGVTSMIIIVIKNKNIIE